ncbi:MAG: transposase [Lachnospiraceae bacterium]
MPRAARKESATKVYHIIARGLNKEAIFQQDREKKRFLKLMQVYIGEFNIELYGFCVMPNHVHLLLKSELSELSIFLAKVLASYAHYYNYKHKRIGYVFQDRYKSQCVENEEYFWHCLRYIHLNPVKAKLISNIDQYPYSSFIEYFRKTPRYIHIKAITMFLSKFKTKLQFLQFHTQKSKELFDDIDEEIQLQRKEVLLAVLQQLAKEENQSIEEILECGEYKEKYLGRLKILSLSKKKLERLILEIRSEI